MLAHLGHGGRLAHGPQPRPRRRPGLQCALSPLNRFGFAQPATEYYQSFVGASLRIGTPILHDLNVFSAGFVPGMLGMYISAWLYGYRRVA